MPASFFDSNVILYLASGDSLKADCAEGRLADGGNISVQVLNEIANVTRRKLGFSWAEVTEFLTPLRETLTVIDVTEAVHAQGLWLAERYGFAIYDAMIVAAALTAGCDTLWSEDMHDGLVVEDRLTIRNPFREQAL